MNDVQNSKFCSFRIKYSACVHLIFVIFPSVYNNLGQQGLSVMTLVAVSASSDYVPGRLEDCFFGECSIVRQVVVLESKCVKYTCDSVRSSVRFLT